jgi:hypothetical protein
MAPSDEYGLPVFGGNEWMDDDKAQPLETVMDPTLVSFLTDVLLIQQPFISALTEQGVGTILAFEAFSQRSIEHYINIFGPKLFGECKTDIL